MCEWPASETNLAPGISAAARLAASCISSASPAQMRHGTRHVLRSCETAPSARTDRQAASSAGRIVLLERPRPRGLREAIVERNLEGFHEALHAFPPGGGDCGGDRLRGRRLEVPGVRLVAAEDERVQPFGRMLADRVAEPRSPRGANEVRTFDAERVEDCDSVPNTGRERIRGWLARLVASALTAMIGEDQPELFAQRTGKARCLRDLERIGEPGVEENRQARASRVLEVGADAVLGVRRVRQALSFVRVLNLHVSGRTIDSTSWRSLTQAERARRRAPRRSRRRGRPRRRRSGGA